MGAIADVADARSKRALLTTFGSGVYLKTGGRALRRRPSAAIYR
jgi:hypothetical protein